MKQCNTDELNSKAIEILQDNQLLEKYHQLRRGGKRFLNKAIRINQKGDAFNILDFRELPIATWKQYVFSLREAGFVETILRSSIAFYRVKGFRLSDYWEKIATKTTGVSTSNNYNDYNNDAIYQNISEYLSDIETPALHNIRLHFVHDYLYIRLKQHLETKPWNMSYNKSNKFITIRSPIQSDNGIEVQIILTRTKLIQVIIKSTYKPITYTESGVYSLIAKLGGIREYLSRFASNIPPVMEWMFIRADFGIDCKKPVNRMFPTMEFKDILGSLVRLYAKSWNNENKRLRVETIISPNKSVESILKEAISNQYRYANITYPVII